MFRSHIFISYSHKDEIWKDKIQKELSDLLAKEEIDVWEDRKIGAGDNWYDEISNAMDRSTMAILLISNNFLNSDFITQIEFPELLRKQAEEGLTIIPIILDDCSWKENIFIQKKQARPVDGKALTTFDEQKQLKIIKTISAEIKELRNKRIEQFREKLLIFLKTVKQDAEKLPTYFPKNAKLMNIRTRVRVSKKGVMQSKSSAQERENILKNPPSESSIYRYKMKASGMEAINSKNNSFEEEPKIQYWDTEIRKSLKRGVIVGDPGFGKSWLLRWEAITLAENAIQILEENFEKVNELVIPIPMRLFDLSRIIQDTTLKEDKHFPDFICQFLQSQLLIRNENKELAYLDLELLAFLKKRTGTANVVLLLDAMDEVPNGEPRNELLKYLQECISRSPDSRILLTSRHANYKVPWKGIPQTEEERELELLPFNTDQIFSFIKSWFGENVTSALQMENLILESPQLRGLAELPLLLGFLCRLYDYECRGGTELFADGYTIGSMSRSKLYWAIVERILLRVWDDEHPERKDLLPQKNNSIIRNRIYVLQEIGFHFFLENKVQFSHDELEEKLVEIIKNNNTSSNTTSVRDQASELITEFSQERGILIQGSEFSGFNQQFLFLHLTIHEYLCADFLSRLINKAGWEHATMPDSTVKIKDFIDRMSWNRRWEQVILLLSSILIDPIPLIVLLQNEKKDDLFHHRKALGAHCMGDIWLMFENDHEVRNLNSYNQLKKIRDQLSSDIFNVWINHQKNGSANLIPHISSAMPTLVRSKGEIKGVSFPLALIQLIKKSKDSKLKNAAVNLLIKAKNELISDEQNIKGILEILKVNKDDNVNDKLLDVLLGLSQSLYGTNYYSELIVDFLFHTPAKSIVKYSLLFLYQIQYSKQKVADFDTLKISFNKNPSPSLRLEILQSLKNCTGTIHYFLFSDKISGGNMDEGKDAMKHVDQAILDLQKKEIIYSQKIEAEDTEAIRLIEVAIELQSRLDNINSDRLIEILDTFEVDGQNFKDLISSGDEEIQFLLSNEETKKTFYLILKKVLDEKGIFSMTQFANNEDELINYSLDLLQSLTKMLKTENTELKIKVLETITDFAYDFKEDKLNNDEIEEYEQKWAELQVIIIGMLEDASNDRQLAQTLMTTFETIRKISYDLIQEVLQFKQEYLDNGEDRIKIYLQNLFNNLGLPLANNEQFLTAYIQAALNIDISKISITDDYQSLVFKDKNITDTNIDLFSQDLNSEKKASILRALGIQNKRPYRTNDILKCIETGLSSNKKILIEASLESARNIGEVIIQRDSIVGFLINTLQNSNDIDLLQESAQTVRVLANLDDRTFAKHANTIEIIVDTLLHVYNTTKNSNVRYSVSLSLFKFCKSRYRIFTKVEPSILPHWMLKLAGKNPIKYETISINTLTESSSKTALINEN